MLKYYNELMGDIYDQPADDGHTRDAVSVFNEIASIVKRAKTVLDVGCGEGFLSSAVESVGMKYFGVSRGHDVKVAQEAGLNVVDMDFNFLDFPDNRFDLIFARHVLEHSPMPIISLMEWHRVAKKHLCLVAPNPEYYTWAGRNHYSMANRKQLVWWLRRAGWKLQLMKSTEREFHFLCLKEPRIGYEGYASVPLSEQIHAFERDIEKLEFGNG